MHLVQLKHFLQAQKPSNHLRFMAYHNQLDPEIANMIGVPQDSEHHPEGSVFIHTLMVVDEAAEISARNNLSHFDNAVLRLAALCHDMGKATHTQITVDGKIISHGHPEAGIAPATSFLTNNIVPDEIIEHILPLVNLHMAWVGFYTPDITSKSMRKLLHKLQPSNIQMLAYIVEADMSGRGGKYFKQGLPQRMKDMMMVAHTLNNPIDVYPDHLVTGEDIMACTNIVPSPLLGKVKAALYKAQLEGKFATKEAGILFLLNHVVIAE